MDGSEWGGGLLRTVWFEQGSDWVSPFFSAEQGLVLRFRLTGGRGRAMGRSGIG